MRVFVSALFPSNIWRSSGNPVVSQSNPTVTCGSTRRSLLIPTLRRPSSLSVSKYNVVTSYKTMASDVEVVAWA